MFHNACDCVSSMLMLYAYTTISMKKVMGHFNEKSVQQKT